nr:phosphotransferase [Auraticoccus cholistanensis]
MAGLAAPTRLRTVEVARVRTVEAGSVVVLEPLAGMSLLELGRRADDAVVLAAWRATAELLAALQAGDPGSATWSSQQEESATRRLVEPAVAAGLLDAGAVELVEQVAGRLHRLGAPDRVVPLHRDLHDQQVLVDAEAGRAPRLGLLDCDTAVAGDPALDPGNLLAHLRLRVLQGLLRPDRAATAAAALGAVTGGSGEESLRLHQRLTLLRLAGLYVWRPRWRHLGPALLAAAREEAPTPA